MERDLWKLVDFQNQFIFGRIKKISERTGGARLIIWYPICPLSRQIIHGPATVVSAAVAVVRQFQALADGQQPRPMGKPSCSPALTV